MRDDGFGPRDFDFVGFEADFTESESGQEFAGEGVIGGDGDGACFDGFECNIEEFGLKFIDGDAVREAKHRGLECDLDIAASGRRCDVERTDIVASDMFECGGFTGDGDIDGGFAGVVNGGESFRDREFDGDMIEVHGGFSGAEDDDGDDERAEEGDHFLREIIFHPFERGAFFSDDGHGIAGGHIGGEFIVVRRGEGIHYFALFFI